MAELIFEDKPFLIASALKFCWCTRNLLSFIKTYDVCLS